MKTKKLISLLISTGMSLCLLSSVGLANIGESWSCRAVVPQFCKNKTTCIVVFEQQGAMKLNFGMPFSQLKPGTQLRIHGKLHKIIKIESVSPGFKIIEFKVLKNKK